MASDQALDDDGEPTGTAGSADDGPAAARLELLREENRRLREEHRRLRGTRHRRTAVGLAALGVVSLAGAALFPGPRDVLLALAGVGLFAGVLVYYLTPERFVAASVGEAVYDAHAGTGEDLTADLGLADERVYLPAGERGRLFVPQHEDYQVPGEGDLEGVVVVADDERRRGVALHPTGGALVREFERTVAGEPAEDPGRLAEQLGDAVVEAFELADGAEADAGAGRLTVAVADPVYGPVDGFDHPIASFVGLGAAVTLETAVAVETARDEAGRADWLVTATWAGDGEPEG